MTMTATNMELLFQRESLRDTIDEVRLLWQSHYAETEQYRRLPLCPDEAQFFRMEEMGMWRQFTARADGQLVGHLGYIVHQDRHTSVLCAIEDYFYLLPAHRAGSNAIRLLRFAIASLKEEGCQQIGMSSKMTHDIDPLLRRVGFACVAKLYLLK